MVSLVNSLAMDADTGIPSNNSFVLIRYDDDGSVDPDFGSAGVAIADFSEDAYGRSIALQPDGKILVAGSVGPDFGLARFNSDGSLDLTFSGDGMLTMDFQGFVDFGQALAVQGDGNIVLAGTASNGVTNDFALARFTANGDLDTSFGTGGLVTTDFGDQNVGSAIAIQPDGKILVGGWAFVEGTSNFALARYKTDGRLDQTFGTGGKLTTAIGPSASITAILVRPDHNVVIVGRTNRDIAIARYLDDGSLD